MSVRWIIWIKTVLTPHTSRFPEVLTPFEIPRMDHFSSHDTIHRNENKGKIQFWSWQSLSQILNSACVDPYVGHGESPIVSIHFHLSLERVKKWEKLERTVTATRLGMNSLSLSVGSPFDPTGVPTVAYQMRSAKTRSEKVERWSAMNG